VGSKTEQALLNFCKLLRGDYMRIRAEVQVLQLYPFNSERKRMSTIVRHRDGNQRIYTKGASEIVLEYCTRYLNKNGDVVPMTDEARDEFAKLIHRYATDALRTIAMAYADLGSDDEVAKMDLTEAPESDLVFIGIVGIQDPVRPEVPDAVKACQRAGIRVRMVTGDNVVTARNIARQCGILSKGGIVMEGSEFRRLTPDQMDRLVPNLEVLARSSPTDKQLLVGRLKMRGDTVAVTGDGTNDGPALKLADVGFAMGIAGTEVAKEASDIIIMDDNFASIVKAVIWGRSVYDSVRKFLQFQLTVNVTAVFLTFVSAISDDQGQSVLTAVQLLWVNLIMDTMAALALATEPPTAELLNRPPHSKADSLISFFMWRMIIGQAILQVVVALTLLYAGPAIFHLQPVPGDPEQTEINRAINRTMVFNTFVFLQIFNEFNARSIDQRLNVFKNLGKHYIFQAVLVITVILQALIIQFGGQAFKTYPLNWWQWLVCICLGPLSLVVGVIVRLLPDWRRPKPPVEVAFVTREKLLWENAINDVRTQVRVVTALRRNRAQQHRM
jgi:P-type Ca2+ transporter type 2C